MKKRVISMLLAAAMVTGLLAGCGNSKGKKDNESSESGAVVLDMYHSWSTDSERGAALDKLIQDFNKENEKVEEEIRDIHIKVADKRLPILSLSGGNQQKVVIGKGILTDPKILLMDEPSRGIDIGAKT